jgi:hypothetical protein
MRLLLFMIATLAFCALCATGLSAMELLMFRQAGCPWCAVWDREVGPVYGKTAVGRRAPVRFVDLGHSRDGGAQLKSPARFSPTFVLLDGGREIGRIEGYPGEDFFWGLLEAMMPKPDTTEGAGAQRPQGRTP